MKDFIYESNLENYYKELDIDVHKFKMQRITYSLVFSMLGLIIAGAFIFTFGKDFIILGALLFPLCAYIGWKYLYYKLKSLSNAHKKQMDMLFPEFLTTFMSLLESQANGNVIIAIENTIPYVKEPLKTQLVVLVRRIYDDASADNAYFAFNEFSKAIANRESEQILSLLLDMYTEGVNRDTLKELESRIERMKQNQIRAYAKWKNGRMRNRASFAGLGLAVFFIFAWIGVVATHYLRTALEGANL